MGMGVYAACLLNPLLLCDCMYCYTVRILREKANVVASMQRGQNSNILEEA